MAVLRRARVEMAPRCRLPPLRIRHVGLAVWAWPVLCSVAMGVVAGDAAGVHGAKTPTDGDFVSAGCGGGFTGGGTYYRLSRDGVLSVERRRSAGSQPERTTLRRDAKELAARLLAHAEHDDFPRSWSPEVGGMTCSLVVLTGGQALDYRWPLGGSPPPLVEQIHAALVQAGREAEKHRPIARTNDREAASGSNAGNEAARRERD